jgi:hypothetical protein
LVEKEEHMIGRIIGLLSIPLMALSIYGIIRQINKDNRLRIWSPILNLIMAPLSLIINVLFFRQTLIETIGPLFLVLGLGFGFAWGMTMKLSFHDGNVIGRQSIIYLIFLGLSYAITQLIATFAPATWITGGLVLIFFSTGSALGSSLNQIVRILALQNGFAQNSSKIAALLKLDLQPPTLPEVEPSFPIPIELPN